MTLCGNPLSQSLLGAKRNCHGYEFFNSASEVQGRRRVPCETADGPLSPARRGASIRLPEQRTWTSRHHTPSEGYSPRPTVRAITSMQVGLSSVR